MPTHTVTKPADLPAVLRSIELTGENVLRVIEHDDYYLIVTRGIPKLETR